MHCVRIVYPTGAGRSFDWRHYFDVHLPLGLGLLRRHAGVTPERVEVERELRRPDGSCGPYQCVCSLYFREQRGVDALIGLFQIESVARELEADWPNYTDVRPELLIGETQDVDPVTVKRIAA
jgi:uncharacterized protein (TIGR02118 family)